MQLAILSEEQLGWEGLQNVLSEMMMRRRCSSPRMMMRRR
jgi:hypothetical protein